MNVWMAASIVLAAGFVPCAVVCVRADVGSALAALSVASIIAVVLLMTMTMVVHRPPFIELGLVLAPVGVVGSLGFVRFLERRR
jgi:multisubunit Na+/H+ antiporter MnhF subunit